MSDALFGADGTELPALRSDPSGRSGWRDVPELPPLALPVIPDLDLTREAIAAALGEDPTGPVDQDPAAAPAQQPAAPSNVVPPSVPQENVFPTNVTPTNVPLVNAPPVNVTASLPTSSAPQAGGPPAAGAPGHRPRQAILTPVTPTQPPRRPSGLRYRPPLAVGSRTPVQLVGLRRRDGRQGPGLPLQTRSNGGAGVFFLIALIIFGVLVYAIIAGIVESILRLFQ